MTDSYMVEREGQYFQAGKVRKGKVRFDTPYRPN